MLPAFAAARQATKTGAGKAMRRTEASFSMMQGSSRALRLSAAMLGIGLLLISGAARAQDSDDDDKTFEEKIIEGIMAGIGGTNMENRGIDYRERSPLVVPPKLDLPPPVSAKSEVNDPNWPKDPDLARRKAAIAANKKSKPTPAEAAQPMTPEQLAAGKTAPSARDSNDPVQPGVSSSPMLSPSQLGFDGKLSTLLGGNKPESKPFAAEPPRQSLTEPPPGYQTPSPNYAYGTGPQESLNGKHVDVMTGKETSN
jgi:hypothetical protein